MRMREFLEKVERQGYADWRMTDSLTLQRARAQGLLRRVYVEGASKRYRRWVMSELGRQRLAWYRKQENVQ